MSKYPEVNFEVVLLEPQIPNNTGNIGRLCVATCSRLNLVHPLGFEVSDSRVKRSGLDYWPDLEWEEHTDLDACLNSKTPEMPTYYFSAHGTHSLFDIDLSNGAVLVFGREADGLPKDLLKTVSHRSVRIPFPGKVRSFNLANAVAMVLSEGIRQKGV